VRFLFMSRARDSMSLLSGAHEIIKWCARDTISRQQVAKRCARVTKSYARDTKWCSRDNYVVHTRYCVVHTSY
jgi:hypothetical protein